MPSGSAFTDQVNKLLDQSNDYSDPSSFTIHLYPTDATNIIAAMKSIVTGFTEQDVLEQGICFEKHASRSKMG